VVNRNFVLVFAVVLVAGCASREERTTRAVNHLKNYPDKHICGVMYDLDYFTGDRDIVFSTDVEAAQRISNQRNIKCDVFYDELIELNRAGKAAYDAERQRKRAERSSHGSSSGMSTYDEFRLRQLEQEKMQRNTDCIINGGVMIANKCTY